MARATKLFWDWVTDRVMPFMVEGNYSIQGALNWLNSRGIDFSERRFISAYRNAAKQLWSQPFVSALPLGSKVPVELRTSRDFVKDRRYMYHVKVRTVDERTGKVTMRRRAFYSNRDLTLEQVAKQAESNWAWKYENYGFVATNFLFDYMEENERSL